MDELFSRIRQEIEKSVLLQALAHARYNKSKAARLLRISRSKFCYRLKKYALDEG